jgi:hypothetical protein
VEATVVTELHLPGERPAGSLRRLADGPASSIGPVRWADRLA